MLLGVDRVAALRMRKRSLWPTHRRTDDPGLQLAWGLLQGCVVGLVIVATVVLIRLVT
jgi:hypothetical protein